MSIQANELAAIKTTGEVVFVLSITGDEALVRRPNQGNSGIFHNKETFLLTELESQQDFESRQLSHRAEMYQQIQQLTKEGNSTSESALPTLH